MAHLCRPNLKSRKKTSKIHMQCSTIQFRRTGGGGLGGEGLRGSSKSCFISIHNSFQNLTPHVV